MKINLETDATVEIDFNPLNDYVHVIVEGHIDFEGFSNVLSTIVTSPDYKNCMARIWTLSDADLSDLDMDALQELTKLVQKYPKGIKDSKVALVSSKKINMGLCKLFKTYSGEEESVVEVFEEFDDAVEWISS